MARRKLHKIRAAEAMPNTFSAASGMKGKWARHFGNKNPLVLELGCGKGAYTTELAAQLPERNFIGVDVKGDRLYYGARRALEENLRNVAFLRIRIEDIEAHFKKGEVSEIWITFPDPHPKKKKGKHRLTHPDFLARYRGILKKNAPVHLKTDDEPFFDFSLESVLSVGGRVLEERRDIHAGDPGPLLAIRTPYEKKWMEEGRSIFYARFSVV